MSLSLQGKLIVLPNDKQAFQQKFKFVKAIIDIRSLTSSRCLGFSAGIGGDRNT